MEMVKEKLVIIDEIERGGGEEGILHVKSRFSDCAFRPNRSGAVCRELFVRSGG